MCVERDDRSVSLTSAAHISPGVVSISFASKTKVDKKMPLERFQKRKAVYIQSFVETKILKRFFFA